MKNPWMHKLAVTSAAVTLFSLITGAMLTDYRQTPPVPPMLAEIHLGLSVVVAALALALAVGLTASKEAAWLKRWAWVAVALLIGAGGIVNDAALAAAPRAAGAIHALLVHSFFCILAVIAVGTSRLWSLGADEVHDQGWPSLRFLGNAMAVLVFTQVTLGAAFRHKATGLMPHLVGAMIVALWILIVCMFVMQQFPEHRALRPAANALLAITLTQVFFGIAALTMRMLSTNTTPALLISTAGHVTIGALTLAAAMVLTVQIRRNVLPKLQEEEDDEPASETAATS